MKYKVALLENAGRKIRARKQSADALGGILVFNEKEHGGFGKRATVANNFAKKSIARAALQTVDYKGERLFGVKLFL